jgi:hypothetical protein
MSDQISTRFNPVPKAEAHTAAQRMLECTQLHGQSSHRDSNDQGINKSAVSSDQQNINVATAAMMVNQQILEALQANRPIPTDLRQQAIELHQQCRDLNNQGSIGDVQARSKDLQDMKSEQQAINSDSVLLKNNNLSAATRAMLSEDMASKTQLKANEQKDFAREARYMSVDDHDNKMNKLVLDALTANSPNLRQLLIADNISKTQVVNTRQADIKFEGQYNCADTRDQLVNQRLTDALTVDPYLSAMRRQDANVPVWTFDKDLQRVERIQHEKRRLHLAPTASPQDLKFAEELDMNKLLNLPPWATKEARIAAREKHQMIIPTAPGENHQLQWQPPKAHAR